MILKYIFYKNKMIEIYTDGSCKGNPGKGGWGVYIKEGLKEIELYGMEENTTNNRMELTAILKIFPYLKKTEKYIIYTDSQYVYRGILFWLEDWKKRNWKKVKNIDLWKEMDINLKEYKDILEFHWIKGHNGNIGNEIADKLAKKMIF